ncbi:hypothetical protein CANCADRAFT_126351 [Tortispora caseinolytica NRRL Y-17796]|uniref:GTP-binding protein n=1 Tax=Tortispora caseinolytica NRRL Y-17796 TaxID=767744 RepID=A0A1E4TA54_9ASCO|nr:hypothetical protein CANCADRAFT_126351 [Tortispora caseinolytica NRRL Y-17796]
MTATSSRRKLLLMGRSGSGKSSMRSIIFSNYSAYDTRRLGATMDVEHSNLRFLGNMTLNLWDCAGQDAFMETYFTTQKDHIFRMVEVLIHVFDVESEEISKDVETFALCLRQLSDYSPNAKIFVLIHKIDLVQPGKREEVYSSMMQALRETSKVYGFPIQGYATSIWDESLYKAWSSIVCELIPNMNAFESHLQHFAKISEAQEAILFEKTTFLVISHASYKTADMDPKRFEKISNIIKTYKQSCSKMRSQFQSLQLRGPGCTIIIENLTSNMFIMVILPRLEVQRKESHINAGDEDIVSLNIKAARKTFERLEMDKAR